MTLNTNKKTSIETIIKKIEVEAGNLPVIAYATWALPVYKYVVNVTQIVRKPINILEEIIIDVAKGDKNRSITIGELADILCMDRIFVDDAIKRLINDNIIDKSELPYIMLLHNDVRAILDGHICIEINKKYATSYYEKEFNTYYTNVHEGECNQFYAIDFSDDTNNEKEESFTTQLVNKIISNEDSNEVEEKNEKSEIIVDNIVISEMRQAIYGEFWTYDYSKRELKCFVWDYSKSIFRKDISDHITKQRLSGVVFRQEEKELLNLFKRYWNNQVEDNKKLEELLQINKNFILESRKKYLTPFIFYKINYIINQLYFPMSSILIISSTNHTEEEFALMNKLGISNIKILSFNEYLNDSIAEYNNLYNLKCEAWREEIDTYEDIKVSDNFTAQLVQLNNFYKEFLHKLINIDKLNKLWLKYFHEQYPEEILCLKDIRQSLYRLIKMDAENIKKLHETSDSMDLLLEDIEILKSKKVETSEKLNTIEREFIANIKRYESELDKVLNNFEEEKVYRNKGEKYLEKRLILLEERDSVLNDLKPLLSEFESFCIQKGYYEFINDNPGENTYSDNLFEIIEKHLVDGKKTKLEIQVFYDLKCELQLKQAKYMKLLQELEHVEAEIINSQRDQQEYDLKKTDTICEHDNKKKSVKKIYDDQKSKLLEKIERYSRDIDFKNQTFNDLNKDLDYIEKRILNKEEVSFILEIQDNFEMLNIDELLLSFVQTISKIQNNNNVNKYLVYYRFYLITQVYGPLKQYNYICLDQGQEYSVFDFCIIKALTEKSAIINIYGDMSKQKAANGISSWNDIYYISDVYEFN